MILADIDSGLYKTVLILHIVSVLVAFAPAVIHPIMSAQYKGDGESQMRRFVELALLNGRRIYVPALVAIGGFGIALVLLSDDYAAFDQTWISLALLVWLAICGVVTAVIMPGERKVAAGVLEAEKQIVIGGQVTTLLLVVMLYLMVFKPGL